MKKILALSFIVLCMAGIYITNIISSSSPSSSRPKECPGFHHVSAKKTSWIVRNVLGVRTQFKCEKNTTDPAIYKDSITVQLDDRFFELPLGYAGKDMPDFVKERPPNFLKLYSVTALYPSFEEGFPYFYEEQRGAYSDQKIGIIFYLLNDVGAPNEGRPIYSSQKDFEKHVEWNSQKDIADGRPEATIQGFEGFKKSFSSWYYKKDASGKVSDLLDCDKPHANHRPSICTLVFMDKDSNLGFKVVFPKKQIEDWENIKTESIKLIKSFEKKT